MIIDCTNVEMRDALPDLLNGKLVGDNLARVNAHVDSCAPCADELSLLRTVRACVKAPNVNVSAIASAIPARYQPWRNIAYNVTRAWPLAAAAVALIAIGSLINVNPSVPDSVEVASIEATQTGSAEDAHVAGLALVGGIEQLSDDNLESLTNELATLEAKPSTEVEQDVVFIDEESIR